MSQSYFYVYPRPSKIAEKRNHTGKLDSSYRMNSSRGEQFCALDEVSFR